MNMAQNISTQIGKYLSKDINLILGDLLHLRWCYQKKEIETLPLVKFTQLERDKTTFGFVLGIEKNIHGDKISMEYEDNISVIPISNISSFTIVQVTDFAHYFVAIPKESIEKTATSLSIKQKMQNMEKILQAEGIKTKVSYELPETYTMQEKWLFQQLLTDLCMAIVEACQLSVVKETLVDSLKEIEFKVSEENNFAVEKNTLKVTLSFKETQSTRTQRAEIINKIMEAY